MTAETANSAPVPPIATGASTHPESVDSPAATREVRFAVVMYGGVSLAIYINGVAQELLQMVRATAQDRNGKYKNYNELSGSEKIYREISHILADSVDLEFRSAPVRFIVDAISGSSAGGINGIFLSKALAKNEQLKDLEQLWITEGAIESLINDKHSVESPLALQDPPQSLLNGQRMYLKLLEALDQMDDAMPNVTVPSGTTLDDTNATDCEAADALVNELDLFITATDLRGVVLPMRLADQVAFERRHRNVFHFVFNRKKEDDCRNDFKSETNPFLAFAARATSSFPFAFEPMALADIDQVLEVYPRYSDLKAFGAASENWKKFYRTFHDQKELGSLPFEERPFADGGDLDNKPFSYVVDTLLQRQSDIPIQRKLLYIEPSPESPQKEVAKRGKPDFLENVLAALSTLPTYETIREDLQRINARNNLVERLKMVIELTDEDIPITIGDREKPEKPWIECSLEEMINWKGKSYGYYRRIRFALLTDELARLVARVANYDETSDYFLIVRALIRTWRRNHYSEDRVRDWSKFPVNHFLYHLDFTYRLRRANFLQNKLEEMYCKTDDAAVRSSLRKIKAQLNSEYIDLRRRLRSLRTPQNQLRDTANDYADIQRMIGELIELLGQILSNQEKSTSLIDSFLSQPSEVSNHASNGKANRSLKNCGRQKTAREIAEEYADRLMRLDSPLDKKMQAIAEALVKALHLAETEEGTRRWLSDPQNGIQSSDMPSLLYYFEHYEDYDMITLPIMYGSDVGELSTVEIYRVSPQDAIELIDENKTGCRKLAGTALGHFGAFMDRRWRQNDILWGRLDGAERIITSLLPADFNPNERAKLIGRAQAEIVYDAIRDLGELECQDLLCESSMRTKSRRSEPELLDRFIAQIKENGRPELCEILKNTAAMRDRYLKIFADNSKLQPQSTLEVAARATTVIGKMFQDVSDRHKLNRKPSVFLVRAGQVAWGLVEVSVPRSIQHLVFRYWLKLLYLFNLLLILGGTLFTAESVQRFGLICLAFTVSIDVATWLIGLYISRRYGIIRIARAILVGLVTLILTAGGLSLVGILGHDRIWKGVNVSHDWLQKTIVYGVSVKWLVVTALAVVLLLGSFRSDLMFWRKRWFIKLFRTRRLRHRIEPT